MLIKADSKLGEAEVLLDEQKDEKPAWLNAQNSFAEMNVIGSEEDLLVEIIKKIKSLKEGSFQAKDNINELEEMFK